MKRWALIGGLLGALWLSGAPAPALAEATEAALPEVTVWRSPSCGCCGDWITHMRDAGFTVRDVVQPEMHDVKVRLGVPARYASCHTATVGDYLLEGHVPAEDVKRLLSEAPQARGLLVPGMPIGSPGMEIPGRPNDAYEVLLLEEGGGVSVFASH